MPGYAALYSVVLNLATAAAATVVFDLLRVSRGADETTAEDYLAEREEAVA